MKLASSPAKGYTGSAVWSATVADVRATESQISFAKNADGTFATDANGYYTATIQPGTLGDITFTASYSTPDTYSVSATPGANAAIAAVTTPANGMYSYSATDDTTVTIKAVPAAGYTYDATWVITVDGKTIAADAPGAGSSGSAAAGTSTTVRAAMHSPIVTVPQPVAGQPGTWTAVIQPGVTGKVVFTPSFSTGDDYALTATGTSHFQNGTVKVTQPDPAQYTFSTTGTTSVTLAAEPTPGYDKAKAVWSLFIKDVGATDFKEYAFGAADTGKVTEPLYDASTGTWSATVNANTSGQIDFRVAFDTPAVYSIAADSTGSNVASANAFNSQDDIDVTNHQYTFNPDGTTQVEIHAAPSRGFTDAAAWEIRIGDRTVTINDDSTNDGALITTPVKKDMDGWHPYHAWTCALQAGTYGDVTIKPIFDTAQTYDIVTERGATAKQASASLASYTYKLDDVTQVSLTATPTDTYTGDAAWSAIIDGTPATAEQVSFGAVSGGSCTATIQPDVVGRIVFTPTFSMLSSYDVVATAKAENNAASAQVTTPASGKYAYSLSADTDVVIEAAPTAGYTYDATWQVYVNGQLIAADAPGASSSGDATAGTSSTVRAAMYSPIATMPQPVEGQPGTWTAKIQAGVSGKVEFIPLFKTSNTFGISGDATNTTDLTFDPAEYTFSTTADQQVTIEPTMVPGYDISQATWSVYVDPVFDDQHNLTNPDCEDADHKLVSAPAYDAESGTWKATIYKGTAGEVYFKAWFSNTLLYSVGADTKGANVQSADAYNTWSQEEPDKHQYKFGPGTTDIKITAEPKPGYAFDADWEVYVGAELDEDGNITNADTSKDVTFTKVSEPQPATDADGKVILGEWTATIQAGTYGDVLVRPSFTKPIDYSISTQRGDHALEVTASPESYSFGTDAAIDLKATPTLGYAGNAEWSATVNGVAATDDQIVFGTDTKGSCTATILAGTLGPVVFTASFADHDAYAVSASAGQHAQSASVAPSSSTPTIVEGADDTYTYTYDPAQDTHVVIDAKPSDGYTTNASWVIKVNGGNDAGGYEITYAADSDDPDAGEGGDTGNDGSSTTDPDAQTGTGVYAAFRMPTVTEPQLVTDADGNVSWTARIEAGLSGSVEFVPSFMQEATYDISGDATNTTDLTFDPAEYTFSTTADQQVTIEPTMVPGYDISQATWSVYVDPVFDDQHNLTNPDCEDADHKLVSAPAYDAESGTWKATIYKGTAGEVYFKAWFSNTLLYSVGADTKGANVQSADAYNTWSQEEPDKHQYQFGPGTTDIKITAEPKPGYAFDADWEVYVGAELDEDGNITNADTSKDATFTKVSEPQPATDADGKVILGEWTATIQAGTYGDVLVRPSFTKPIDYSISTQRGDHALEVTASPESYSFGTDAAIDLKATPTLGYAGNAEWSATVNGVAATDDQITFGTDTKGTCTATILAGTLGPVVFTASFADHDAYAVSASTGQHAQSASVAPSSSTPTIVEGADNTYTYTYDPAQDTHVVIDAKPNDGYTTNASWVIKVNGGNDAGGYEITYAADSDDPDAGEGGDTGNDGSDTGSSDGSAATVVKAAMHAPTVSKPQLVTDAAGNVSWTAQIQAGFAGSVEFVPSFNETSEFQITATGVQNYKVNQIDGEEVSSVSVVRPVDAEGNHKYTYYPTPTGDGTDTTEVELTADPTDGYVKDAATWELWIDDGTGSAENNGYTKYQFGTSTDAEPGDGKVTKPVYNSDTGTWTCTILQGTLGAIDFRVSFTEGKSYNVVIDVTAEDDNVREDLDVAKWGPSVSPDTYTFVPTSSEETKAGTVTIKAQPELGYSAQDVVWEVTVGEGEGATTFTIDAEHENDGTVISTPVYNADAEARYWTTDIQKGVFGDITFKPSFPKEATYNITTKRSVYINLDYPFFDQNNWEPIDKSEIKSQLFEAGTENWEITEPKSETYTYNKENETTITYAADILEGFDPTRFDFTILYIDPISTPDHPSYNKEHPAYDPTHDFESDEYIDPYDFSGSKKWDSENNCWKVTLPENVRGDLLIKYADDYPYRHQVIFKNYDGVDDNGDAKPYAQYYPTSTKTKYPYWATYTGKYVIQEETYSMPLWSNPSFGKGPVTMVSVVDSTIMPDANPTRPDDAYYTYTFKGWTEEENPAIDADVIPMEELEASIVKGDKTYYAVYTRAPRQYVVTAEANGSTVDEHHVLDSKVEILEPEATTTEEGPKHYYSAYPESSTERTKVVITAEPTEGWKANPTWEVTVNGVKVEDAYPEPPNSPGAAPGPDDGTSKGTTVKAAMYVQPTQVTMPVWDASANDGKGAYVAEILPGVFGNVEFKVSFNDPDAFPIAFVNEHVKDSEGNATTLYAEDINAGTPYPEFMESDDFKNQVGTPQKPWDNDHAYYFKGWTEEANADVDAEVIPMTADPNNPSAVTPMDQRTVDAAKTYYAVFRSVALHDLTIELYKYADASGAAQQYDYAGPDASSTGSYTVRLPETTSSDDLRQVSVKLPATTATIPAQMKDGSAAEGIAGHMMTSWYLPESDPSASDANAKVDLEAASGEGTSAPTTFSFAGATGEGSDGYLTVTADKLLPADKLPVTGDVTVKLVAGWRATIQGTAATDAARFNLKTDASGSMEAAQFVQLQSSTARALAVSATSAPDAEAFAKLFRTQDGSAAPTEDDMAATAFRFPYFERDYWSTNDETEAYDKAHEFSYTGGATSAQLCRIEGTNSIDQSTTVGKLGLCLADTLRTLTQDEVDGETFSLTESEEEGGGKGEQLGKIVWQLQMLNEADAHQYAFGSATQTWWGEWFE